MIIQRFTANDILYEYLNLQPGTFIDRRYTMYDIIINDYLQDNTVFDRLNNPNHLYDLFIDEFKYEVTYDSIVNNIDMSKFMIIMERLAETNKLCHEWLKYNKNYNLFKKINNQKVLLDIEENYIRSLEPFSTQNIQNKHINNNVQPEFLLEQLCYFHALKLPCKLSDSVFSELHKKSIIKRVHDECYLN